MSDMNMASLVAHVKNAVRQTPVLGIPLVLVSLCLLAAAIVLAPFAAPLAIAYFFLNRSSEESGAKVASLSSGTKTGVTAVPKTPVTTTTVPLSTATSSKDTTAPAETAPPAPAPLTGSAALMAKMRKSGAVTGEKRAATGADTSVSTKASATKASAPPTIVDNNTDSRFFILYGGEASTQIARDLSDKAVANGFAPRLFAMDDFKQCDLCQTPCTAIFVVETIENAQPAEAAGTCLRFFNRKRKSGEKDSLRGVLTYAVLGLGDTNLLLDRQTTTAKDCNQAAQTLDSALLFLGAEKLVTRGECNDAAGLEQAFEPWCKTLFPALAKALSSDGADAASTKNDGADTNAAIQTASIDAPASSPSIKFLYGSQTGNASEICVSMAAEAAGAKGFANVTCNSMNEKDVTDCLAPGNILVFVVSSTGDGDAPDNCDMFFTRLKRAAKAKTGGSVGVGTQYTVLGLGDQNYTAFMAVPRAFSTFMEKAGATAFYPRGEADDTLGLYEYAEVWQDALWEPLRKAVDDAPAFKLDPVKMAQEAAAVKALAKAVVDEEKAAEKARKEMAKESAEAKVEMAKEVTTKDAVPSTVETATPQPVQTATPSKIEGIPALPACRTHVKWLDAGKETAVYPIGGSVAKGDDAAFTAASPFLARVSAKTRMTAPESDRRVLHVEFDLTGGNNNSIGGDTKSTGCNTNSSLDYQPGDSIGVLPMNDSSLVAKIAKRLNLDLTSVFTLDWAPGFEDSKSKPLPHVQPGSTVKQVLTHCIDLTSPVRKSQLRVFAEFCADDDAGKQVLLNLCSKSGKAAYAETIMSERPTLLEVLNLAPSCFGSDIQNTFGAFIDTTHQLQPRLYSITTAPECAPGKPCVAFSVVKHESPAGILRNGVATTWLDGFEVFPDHDGDEGTTKTVPVFIKKSHTFKPPADVTHPMLMIGPGTGVAPFRGFLQRRAKQLKELTDDKKLKEMGSTAKPGACVLFFGCRRRDEDFLYESDLTEFVEHGVLTNLVCAFSREQQEKRYVQHLIAEHAAEVAEIVKNETAQVFVCGDGGGMARDVHAALRNALVSDGGMDEQEAEALLVAMTKQGRYVRDIWS